jgi:hypothetical protein
MMVDLSSQEIVNRPMSGDGGAIVFEISKWFVVAACLVTLLVGSVWVRDQGLTLQYQIEELKRSNKKLGEQNDLLRAEYNALVAPAEVELAATGLGLISSNDKRVLILDGDRPVGDRNRTARMEPKSRTMHE